MQWLRMKFPSLINLKGEWEIQQTLCDYSLESCVYSVQEPLQRVQMSPALSASLFTLMDPCKVCPPQPTALSEFYPSVRVNLFLPIDIWQPVALWVFFISVPQTHNIVRYRIRLSHVQPPKIHTLKS